ncbi:MAG: GxxExxY protein [Verrucomicrobia bacterium]|nr:MAG: GxxExxY protein [Verrucomicrobiota bacterium]
MNANQQLEEKRLVFQIVGCAMEVLNELGHGLREKTYERALCVEFRLQKINYSQQAIFPVIYKGEKVDDYIPDLIVEDRVVVDTKTIDAIGNVEIGKMLNYLHVTGLKVGLLINLKKSKLEWKRVVLSEH